MEGRIVSVNNSFAREVRFRRLYRNSDDGLFIVPLDHSVTTGPLEGVDSLNRLVGQLASNGVDGVVLHKGSLRHVDAGWFSKTSLIVHLSASTSLAPDPDSKYLVASVEESLRLGADAVSVHVNMGSDDEAQQISDLAAVAEECDRWNMPLLAMMYARGPNIDNPRDPGLVAHAVTLAADLGADIVKTVYVGSVTEMAQITSASPIPVIVAGGPPVSDADQVLGYVDEAVRGGAAGVAMGRNVFQAPDPGAMTRELSAVIHRERGNPFRDAMQQRAAAV